MVQVNKKYKSADYILTGLHSVTSLSSATI